MFARTCSRISPLSSAVRLRKSQPEEGAHLARAGRRALRGGGGSPGGSSRHDLVRRQLAQRARLAAVALPVGIRLRLLVMLVAEVAHDAGFAEDLRAAFARALHDDAAALLVALVVVRAPRAVLLLAVLVPRPLVRLAVAEEVSHAAGASCDGQHRVALEAVARHQLAARRAGVLHLRGGNLLGGVGARASLRTARGAHQLRKPTAALRKGDAERTRAPATVELAARPTAAPPATHAPRRPPPGSGSSGWRPPRARG